MRLLTRLRRLLVPNALARTPKVGDPVWWAPKQAKCTVTKVESDGSLLFQGGPLVRRPSGKVVPRWTVATVAEECRWDPQTEVWVVGQGPTPKDVRGTVIMPQPVNARVGTQKGRIF